MSQAARTAARRQALLTLEVCAYCGEDLVGEPWQLSLDGNPAHLRCLANERAQEEVDEKAEDGW